MNERGAFQSIISFIIQPMSKIWSGLLFRTARANILKEFNISIVRRCSRCEYQVNGIKAFSRTLFLYPIRQEYADIRLYQRQSAAFVVTSISLQS